MGVPEGQREPTKSVGEDKLSVSIEDLGIGDHLELALVKARSRGDLAYQKWRTVLQKFDLIRGNIDPVLNENANLDVLLRCLEAEQAIHWNPHARLRMQFQLSRLWIFGAYEGMRTLHQSMKRTCTTPPHEALCGLTTCLYCRVGHYKNDLAVNRVPMAKGEVAGAVNSPKFPNEILEVLTQHPEILLEEFPRNSFLLKHEGIASNTGTVVWVNYDKRVDRMVARSRLEHSDRLLAFFDQPIAPHPAYPL